MNILKIMNLSMEGRLNLACGPRHIYCHPADGNGIDNKALALQPGLDLLNLLFVRAKMLPHLRRADPFMKIDRAGIVLARNKICESRLHLGAALQIDDQMLKFQIRIHHTPVIVSIGFSPDISGKSE